MVPARLIMGCGVPKNCMPDECSSSDGWASHGDALTLANNEFQMSLHEVVFTESADW